MPASRRTDSNRFSAARSPGWNGLLPRSLSEVSLGYVFIEISQLRAAASCDPVQEIADQAEAPPSPLASETVFDEARSVKLNKLSVRSAPQTREQPAPAQVLIRNHCPVLRY